MSDLIAYLRDLLVFKVRPDAIADEFNPEVQSALEAQGAIIETGRLLELIDQFAGAEGRMKWAPNKKLHFEVAVIKAIQTLSQVTLDEVIENLLALRDGKAPASTPSPKLVNPRPAVSNQTPPARVAEKPVVEKPKVVAARVDDGPVDLEALWEKAVDQIRLRRPLIKGWIDSAKPLGSENRSFLLGFPPEQKTAMESIAMPRNRDFVESVLKEISGRDWNLQLSLKEGLLVEMPKVETQKQDPPVRSKTEAAVAFKDDPLIRDALEIFKGEIKT
jgi:DNA polymerase III subunit gamma/tau